MTTPHAIYGRFGQALAFAERTLTETLRNHLAERATTPETWYALQLIATRGPAMAREELHGLLEGSRTLDADSTRELLAQLEADGLIHGDEALDLTDAGSALHRRLREHVLGGTARLLSQFELDDIETTVRTIEAITRRAAEEAAAAAN